MNAEQEAQQDRNEVLTRLDLMESLVREGRRSTEYWGWSFLLWGTAYLIAIGWSYVSHLPGVAWPVTMIAAAAISIVIGTKRKAKPRTTISRAVGAGWIAVGWALFIYCFSAAASGHSEIHSFTATIEVLLGVANFSSALILRWRMQFAVAAIWWGATIATCFLSITMIGLVFIGATLVGMIGFGLYLMYCQRRDGRNRLPAVQHG